MEFSEKLHELRKQKGLTQEELAALLYVSRTAVSKWESGRGYPSIDSLKAISGFFSVSIDDLLSGDALVSIAEEDNRQKSACLRSLISGLLDIGAALLLFLPLFSQKEGGAIRAVSLLTFTLVQPYLRMACFAVVISLIVCGALTLALQNLQHAFWQNHKDSLSILLGISGTLLFIFSRQPYAAAFLFVFLTIKAFLISKLR